MLIDHVSGLSFKDLGDKSLYPNLKPTETVKRSLKSFLTTARLLFKYYNRFSSMLEFDAKYTNQIKGYKRKTAFLWGVDSMRHDFPIILLAGSESYKSWTKFFELFRIINHYLELIVCDDNSPLKIATRFKFPEVKI